MPELNATNTLNAPVKRERPPARFLKIQLYDVYERMKAQAYG